jgi:hypothetical protein
MHLLTSLITLLALLLTFVLGLNVGRARARYGVEAPATAGNPDFERVFRVHYNTLENLVLFVPALWLFAAFVSELWGGALGALWLAGRIWYAVGYYSAAPKRGPGMGVATLAQLALMVGALIGVVRMYFYLH